MLELGRILLIVSMAHAYVFAILFFSFKKRSMKILGYYMLSTFLHYFLYLNTLVFHIESLYAVFYYIIPFLSLTSMPLIYIYVKHMTSENYPLKKKLWFHLAPAGLFLIITTILILRLSPEDRALVFQGETDVDSAILLFVSYVATSFVIIGQVFLYAIKMFLSLYKHDANVEKVYSFKEEVSLRWLKIFVIIYVLYYLFEFTVFLFKGINISETAYFSIISLHVFLVGFMGLKQREIFKEDNSIQPLETNKTDESQPANDEEDASKKLSVVTPEVREETLRKIDFLMNEKKIYLNDDLSLYDLAKELDINKNYLSHIINDSLESNFFGLINGYRIEEAKRMLLDDNYDHLSVEGIAKSVGFKSRSVFYPVFKKIVGVTPTQFKKDARENRV